MKFRSQVYTAVSGSVGGLTYAHNRGGMYTRGRATPTNPNSAAQMVARATFANLATAWGAVLTQADRDGWSLYATNTPLTDAFGEPLTLSGQQMYNRCNSPRVRSGADRVDTPPVVFGQADLTLITSSFTNNEVYLNYNNADTWAGAVGGHLIVQTSPITAPTINFHKSPNRWAVNEDGAVIPPNGVLTLASDAFGNLFATFPDQRVFCRIRASNADGRLSPIQTLSQTLT
jgi:hypothetical protein